MVGRLPIPVPNTMQKSVETGSERACPPRGCHSTGGESGRKGVLTILRISFAALATDTGHVILAVPCDHTRGVEEDSPAAAGPSLPLSSGRVRSS